MDALKAELERKRKLKEQEFGGRKFVKRGELEQKALERLRREEREEIQAKANRHKSETEKAGKVDEPAQTSTASKSQKEKEEDEDLDKLVLPRAEVIRRLRLIKHPITLFGEDDDARLARLKALLKAGVTIDGTDEMMEGQKNDFLRDMIQLKRTEKQQERLQKKKEKEKKERLPGPDGEEDGEDGAGSDWHSSAAEDDGLDGKIMKADFNDLCDEDKVLVFYKKLLKEWKQEMGVKPEAERRTIRGKQAIVTFQQCGRYLDPLLDMCRKRHVPQDVLRALTRMVHLCRERDYLAAMDVYIKLSIGNAPWPIGVTMVGIHERSAREKIHTSSVAHIMNDETTRKYLQSIKRLMTLCQRRYPSAPSKSVEFNSLANGSDLQSLLMEEKVKKSSEAAADRLRLMEAAADDR